MPTPLEILLDPISLVVIAIFAGLIALETVAPARPLPRVRGWWMRALVSFGVYFYLSSYLPLLTDAHLARYQLFDLTGWGTAGGVLAGLLVFELGVYLWHRAVHGSNLLWRSFHQMHHSAERLDAVGSFYFSPLDMIGWTLLGSLTLVLVVGITPQAATIVLLTTVFLAIFQHANLRTPKWLGYIVQRPESHSVHHERGVHASNYSDLPIFDIAFGTFRNPDEFQETGFYPDASARVADMLLWRDISNEPS
jgi:sterol desaturase/sphingolipid hydroxylase (fatty acid hydroxylase superfamily)